MTGRVLVLAVAGCLLGCSGPAAQQASSTRATSATSSASTSTPSTTPLPSAAGSSPVGAPAGTSSTRPAGTAASNAPAGRTAASTASAPRDPVAVQNCRNTQEAYRAVVSAVYGPADALRAAATDAAPPPVDTNATTAEGRTATHAILALQDAVLQVAAQGAPAVPGLRDRLGAVRSACAAVGAAVFPA